MTPVRIVIAICLAFGAVCIAAIIALLPTPARAQVPCKPLAQMLAELQIRFEEFPLVTADIPGVKFMITTSRDGTFTALNLMPDGTACIAFAGVHFQLHQGT